MPGIHASPPRSGRATSLVLSAISFILIWMCAPVESVAQEEGRRWDRTERDTIPTLGLEQGVLELSTKHFDLELVQASQTIAALRPVGADTFDFTPSDWLDRRDRDGFFHLGDLTLRLRAGDDDEWEHYSTATARESVEALDPDAPVLAAADLASTLPGDIPLQIRRYWELDGDNLVLRFELHNATDSPVEIGSLGIPMVFNNILHERSLDEAHASSSFYDPYIGGDAGYLQVTRLNGHGPALVVVPHGRTPFEGYHPLLADRTQRGITFEGFYEWMVHTKAYAGNEWQDAEPWIEPTSAILAPGESRSYGVEFLVADEIRNIEATLRADGRPVAVGIPGYVLPMDIEAKLFLDHDADVRAVDVAPAGALSISPAGTTENGAHAYDVRGSRWGRARLTITYADGIDQVISYKVIKPSADVVADLGRFLTTKQWFENPDDPFGRSPSVISYDYTAGRQVTEDGRAWIAGLSDEGGAGSWLAAMMKQLIQPDRKEIAKLERFVDDVLWGGIQYDKGDLKYGVRKSMFYYEPDAMPEGTYSDSIGYGGWASWNKEHAMTVGRSYNYPHVAAAYWVLYRLARNHTGLVTNHSWEWYLELAHETSEAMVKHAPHYAQFGQMEGTTFLLILQDLQLEAWTDRAQSLEDVMRERAEHWRSLGFPFGSEMPWDSTGQEEVYAWCRYFGFDEKAQVTLNAILGYMPTVPHWGYNGSARRYWDFWFAGHPETSRLERQLHHYGSALNAIPMLTEFRDNPTDTYLLRTGYGGMMGGIANITQDGFGPSGFHAYPWTLDIDGYSGDYGPGFLGHAINTGTYVARHPELDWLVFGGNLEENGSWVHVKPLDAARSRAYLAPMGLWLTLDAGRFEEIAFEPATGDVRISLDGATDWTPLARLRIDQPARPQGVGTYAPIETFETERDAFLVPLESGITEVALRDTP